jgi:hypothetical protein
MTHQLGAWRHEDRWQVSEGLLVVEPHTGLTCAYTPRGEGDRSRGGAGQRGLPVRDAKLLGFVHGWGSVHVVGLDMRLSPTTDQETSASLFLTLLLTRIHVSHCLPHLLLCRGRGGWGGLRLCRCESSVMMSHTGRQAHDGHRGIHDAHSQGGQACSAHIWSSGVLACHGNGSQQLTHAVAGQGTWHAHLASTGYGFGPRTESTPIPTAASPLLCAVY